jgi:AraC family transcriptional activator of tynA and feaB
MRTARSKVAAGRVGRSLTSTEEAEMTSEDVVSNQMVTDFASSHLPWRLDVRRHAALRHVTQTLGKSWIVDCTLGGMVGRRGPAEIRQTDGEFIAVLLVRRGTEVFTQSDRKTIVAEGTAVIWDGVRAAECYTAGHLDKFTFFLPREVAREALPSFESIVGRLLPASPSLRLLGSWLSTSINADYLDEDASVTAGNVAVDLLTSAIGASSNIVLDTQSIRLMEIHAFIDSHLNNPGLSVEDIARANAVSTRYLHLLFQRTGDTCRQYLSRRRLEAAQRLLTMQPDKSITEVASRCGFASPSSFSRAYRSAYGLSPRATRTHLPS